MTDSQDAKQGSDVVDAASWEVDGGSARGAEGLGDTVVKMPRIPGGKPPVKPTMGRGRPPGQKAATKTGAAKPEEAAPKSATEDLMAAFDRGAEEFGPGIEVTKPIPTVEADVAEAAPVVEDVPEQVVEEAIVENEPVEVIEPVTEVAEPVVAKPEPPAKPEPYRPQVKPEAKAASVTAPTMAMPVPVPAAPPVAPAMPAAEKAPARPPSSRPSAGSVRRTRKARLRLSRIDPWSVMKTVFLFSVAFGIMGWVATYLLWQVLLASGLFAAINDAISNVVSSPTNTEGWRIEEYFSANKVLGIAALIAVINVVISTALGTLGAFLYNLSATILGGLELTLAED